MAAGACTGFLFSFFNKDQNHLYALYVALALVRPPSSSSLPGCVVGGMRLTFRAAVWTLTAASAFSSVAADVRSGDAHCCEGDAVAAPQPSAVVLAGGWEIVRASPAL